MLLGPIHSLCLCLVRPRAALVWGEEGPPEAALLDHSVESFLVVDELKPGCEEPAATRWRWRGTCGKFSGFSGHFCTIGLAKL